MASRTPTSAISPPPESYKDLNLPDIKLTHHPADSPTPTPVIVITLNRPKAGNALTDTLLDSLVTAFDTLSRDARVKAIVLTGATQGDPARNMFCAGMDLREGAAALQGKGGQKPAGKRPGLAPTANISAEDMKKMRDTYRDGGGRAALSMYNCAKPVVVAVNGSAVGGGITLTLAANIRVVSSKAKVGFVFSQRGLCMEATSSFFLPRLVGAGRACHLLTTGSVYPADHKLPDGLFSEVVGPEEVVDTALRLAEDAARTTSAVSTTLMKDLVFRGPQSPEEAHLLESKLFWDLFRGKDAKEGVMSFLQKRAPKFEASVDGGDMPSSWPWWEEKDTDAGTSQGKGGEATRESKM